MRLSDLIKDISKMSPEEMKEHVRQMRHTKIVSRPAATKHAADAEKIVTRHANVKVSKLVNSLSAEDKRQLLLLLEPGDSNE